MQQADTLESQTGSITDGIYQSRTLQQMAGKETEAALNPLAQLGKPGIAFFTQVVHLMNC